MEIDEAVSKPASPQETLFVFRSVDAGGAIRTFFVTMESSSITDVISLLDYWGVHLSDAELRHASSLDNAESQLDSGVEILIPEDKIEGGSAAFENVHKMRLADERGIGITSAAKLKRISRIIHGIEAYAKKAAFLGGYASFSFTFTDGMKCYEGTYASTGKFGPVTKFAFAHGVAFDMLHRAAHEDQYVFGTKLWRLTQVFADGDGLGMAAVINKASLDITNKLFRYESDEDGHIVDLLRTIFEKAYSARMNTSETHVAKLPHAESDDENVVGDAESDGESVVDDTASSTTMTDSTIRAILHSIVRSVISQKLFRNTRISVADWVVTHRMELERGITVYISKLAASSSAGASSDVERSVNAILNAAFEFRTVSEYALNRIAELAEESPWPLTDDRLVHMLANALESSEDAHGKTKTDLEEAERQLEATYEEYDDDFDDDGMEEDEGEDDNDDDGNEDSSDASSSGDDVDNAIREISNQQRGKVLAGLLREAAAAIDFLSSQESTPPGARREDAEARSEAQRTLNAMVEHSIIDRDALNSLARFTRMLKGTTDYP
jgi:hypothetical protein